MHELRPGQVQPWSGCRCLCGLPLGPGSRLSGCQLLRPMCTWHVCGQDRTNGLRCMPPWQVRVAARLVDVPHVVCCWAVHPWIHHTVPGLSPRHLQRCRCWLMHALRSGDGLKHLQHVVMYPVSGRAVCECHGPDCLRRVPARDLHCRGCCALHPMCRWVLRVHLGYHCVFEVSPGKVRPVHRHTCVHRVSRRVHCSGHWGVGLC